MNRRIPPAVVRRLPRYYRYVDALCAQGILRVSSGELARNLGFTASQVRQDFSCLGGFGQQGYGYNTSSLRDNLRTILQLQRGFQGILIGVGNLGLALLNNFDFDRHGLRMLTAFDVAPAKIGQRVGDVIVRNSEGLESFCAQYHPEIAVLTCPGRAAQPLAARLLRCGVQGIWNFTNVDLDIPLGSAVVENVHFSDSLMTLSCRLPLENADQEP